MDYRAAIIVSCWFSVAIISSVYMWVFGSGLSDIMFGVFLPIGILVLIATIVTFGVGSSFEQEKRNDIRPSKNPQDILLKLDTITKEIDQIKKEIEK